MKVLLTTLNAKYIHTNLAIRLLYQINKEKWGTNLSWKEFTIKQPIAEIAAYCANYDIVAFSCYIWNITQTINVLKAIKALNPNCKTLLGGPEVSYEYDEFINLPCVDYIISGQGEIPFSLFLEKYPNVCEVPNIIYKTADFPVFNKHNITFDINLLSNINAYIDDPVDELKNKVLYLETSRGCPYKCEFCLASLDNNVRYLPTETIKQNLLYLMQHGQVIKFLDRTFNVKKDFTLDIFDFILKNHSPNNIFQFEITADILHPDIVRYIQEKVPKGLFRFEIGIQTTNQKANLAVSRKQNFEKTSQVIKAIQNKIELHLDLIVGLPFDYMQDIKNSINQVLALHPSELQLGFLKFLRGTPVKEKHSAHGYIFMKEPPYQLIESNYLSKNELQQLILIEHMLEIYWNKKRAITLLKQIALNESIADFLLHLGNYFITKNNLIKFTHEEAYITLYDYLKLNSYKPSVIDLLVFDYAKNSKIKPKPLFKQPLKYELAKLLNKKTTTNLTEKSRAVYYQLSVNPLNPTLEQDVILKLNYFGYKQPEFSIYNLSELNFS
jgi:anaerobic magnesium-protoporphyrin IX monomethyl ester cyclase